MKLSGVIVMAVTFWVIANMADMKNPDWRGFLPNYTSEDVCRAALPRIQAKYLDLKLDCYEDNTP
jgi:hypothetical protein